MKNLLQKLKAFFARKGYEPNPHADTVWMQAETTSVEDGITATASTTVTSPNDIIEEIKRARREVEEFEKTLHSFKQKTTI